MKSSESGIALIAVLLLMSIVGTIVAAAVIDSQTTAVHTVEWKERAMAKYCAESAVNTTISLLLEDIHAYPARKLGSYPIYGVERYMADGVLHHITVNRRNIDIQIFDAVSGIDISGSNPTRQFSLFLCRDTKDASDNEMNVCMKDELLDYVDTDDFVHPHGKEAAFFSENKMPNIPRNEEMEYSEEVRYLPTTRDFLAGVPYNHYPLFRLIPPRDMSALGGRPSLFNAHPLILQYGANLTQEELEQVISAMRLWQQQKQPIYETLPNGLPARLELNFSTMESGTYTIQVTVMNDDNNSSYSTLRVSFSSNAGDNSTIAWYQFFFL